MAGLVLLALTAACDSPTRPSRALTTPSQNQAVPSPTRPDLSGIYTLTLTASSRCASELPEAMRIRRYPATIVQGVGLLVVTVHSPLNLPGMWNDLGAVTGVFGENDDVMFQQLRFDEWWPEEPLDAFSAVGGMTATISAGGLSGLLDGFMSGSRGRDQFTCTAPDHGVVLSPPPS